MRVTLSPLRWQIGVALPLALAFVYSRTHAVHWALEVHALQHASGVVMALLDRNAVPRTPARLSLRARNRC